MASSTFFLLLTTGTLEKKGKRRNADGGLSLETPFMFQWTKRKSLNWPLLCEVNVSATQETKHREQANTTEINRNQEELWMPMVAQGKDSVGKRLKQNMDG